MKKQKTQTRSIKISLQAHTQPFYSEKTTVSDISL